MTSNGVGGFNVSGTHKYAEEGSYATSVSVTANGSAPGVGNATANVGDAALTATGYNLICKGTIFSDTVATFTDADLGGVVSDYTAGIVWGDGKSSNGTIVAFGSGFKVVGTHSYLKRGKYVATVHICESGTLMRSESLVRRAPSALRRSRFDTRGRPPARCGAVPPSWPSTTRWSSAASG